MNLKLGQVYKHVSTGEHVVVLEVRDEHHPRGLGSDGPSACAWPIRDDTVEFSAEDLHIFDCVILAPNQEHHGDKVWKLDPYVWYQDDGEGTWSRLRAEFDATPVLPSRDEL